MEVSKYIMLFHKKLKGEINSQEQEELSDWLEQGGRSGYTEELERVWNLSKRYKEGYEPDVEAGLARLQRRIAASRKPRPLSARRWLSIAAAIALLAAIGWWWMAEKGTTSDNPLLYTTGAGEKLETTLPDGSTVVLNENTFLVLGEDFQKGPARRVELTGEAYFHAFPNPSRPFRITTPDAMVEVLGTAFNLRSYPGEGFTEVEVEEGKVRLTGPEREHSIEVTPGQRGICRPGQPMNKLEDTGLNAHSWRTNRLEFRNAPLGDVLEAVERHYKVELELQNPTIRNCRVTSSFEKASLEEVLQTLSLILNLEIEPAGGSGAAFQLNGGSCSAQSGMQGK